MIESERIFEEGKLEVIREPWEPTALQRKLEILCTTNNLKMIVDIHPALVFDKKLNAGWQEVVTGDGIHG